MAVLLTSGVTGGPGLSIDPSKITAAKLHTATGLLAITYTNPAGMPTVQFVPGQDGVDTYNALVAVAAATLTTGT